MNKQTEALKLALEALDIVKIHFTQNRHVNEAITALQEALAEQQAQQQEPVAWRGYNWGHSPDDWVYRDFDDPILDGNGNNVGQPLYTTPPQRTWIGLTDEDIAAVRDSFGDEPVGLYAFARAAEAKLREKNT